MRKKGITVDYDAERADDLRQAAHAYYHAATTIPPDAMHTIVNMPAPRFYVSEERATTVIAHMLKGKDISNMHTTKRNMYREILARFLLLQAQHPNTPRQQLIRQVIRQPAPHFYLSPAYAQRILRKHTPRWKKEMLQKLLHWHS